jgi:hypothetical protein
MRVGFVAVSAVLLLADTSCGLKELSNFDVREINIDSGLHLIPVGSRWMPQQGDPGSYYFFFHTATGFTTVDHLESRPGTGSPVRLLYLETTKNQILDRTVKTDLILSGAYGNLYIQKECFYASPIQRGYSAVSVQSYFGSSIDARPAEVPSPQDLPPLTSVSLVRVLRVAPEFVVVSANYEVSGALLSVNVSQAKGGEWVSGATHMVQVEGRSDYLQQYGIPVSMDVPGYARNQRFPLPAVDSPQELAAVVQSYGFDKLIRVDVLKDGAAASTRFLQPEMTKEEEQLNPLCEARFRQQLASGLPTVEGAD